MNTGYNFERVQDISAVSNARDGIRVTVLNYMHHQLGWSLEQCEQRVNVEFERQIPKGVFDALQNSGWNFKGAKLLDVGSGQGGAVLEALERGADAYGVEPGDEFRTLARLRLDEAGQNPDRILSAGGERLPFGDEMFDFVISLQVLEHVPDPGLIIKDIYRVLKPGGQCFISCENYLSFREQHYRVPWLPLLPKGIGSIYLRLIGRNPDFLRSHVFYSTYPQIWKMARRAGFHNVTLEERLERVENPLAAKSSFEKLMAASARLAPIRFRKVLISKLIHLTSFWRVGVQVKLVKPGRD